MIGYSKRLSIANRVIRKLVENIFIMLAFLWVLLWVFPWASWLESNWIRLGISILIFTMPGMAISLFLTDKRLSLASHFTSGLALSGFLVALLGLLGRIFHLPFAYIKPVFALIGLLALIALVKHSRLEPQLYKPQRFSISTLILLLGMVVLGIIINFQRELGGDDLSYLAYLTNWQHAQQLDFREVIFGSGNVDKIRFWVAMFPMNLAFLAEISNLHGLLLLGFYLEPYLIAIGILTIYNLYENLLPTERQTIAALLLQFTFLFLLRGVQKSGDAFFWRLSEDKVFAAFILAPVFFIAVRHFLDTFTLRGGIFVLLNGLSLALTHPVILAYSIFISSVFAGVVMVARKDYKKLGVSALLLMVIILPSASLRFIDVPSAPQSFDLDSALAASPSISETRISYIEGTPFYGFNLDRVKIQTNNTSQADLLAIFVSWSYLWVLGLGSLWSLFNLRKNAVAPFTAATSSLVLLCAVPYTGWLVGYFVTARMLWRSPWMLPIGLIGMVLVVDLIKVALRKTLIDAQAQTFSERATFGLILALCFSILAHFSYKASWVPITQLVSYRDNLTKLSTLGSYLENKNEKPAKFIASSKTVPMMKYLPGLSSKAKVILFRTSRYTSGFIHDSIYYRKIKPVLSSSTTVSLQRRINILRNNDIQYILVEERSIKDYYANRPDLFDIQRAGDFWIIEFRESAP